MALSIEIPNPKDLEKLLKKALKEENIKSRIKPLDAFWRIKNVSHNGEMNNYFFSKTLLEPKTQAEHLEYARQNPNELGIADLPLYNSIVKSIVKSGNQEIINFIKKSINNFNLMTGTSIKYKPAGKDEVIHNLSQIIKEGNFIGPNEYMKNSNQKEIYEALTGSKDLEGINNIYKSLIGSDLYLWRINSRPDCLDERVVGLGSGDRWTSLDADFYLDVLGRCWGLCVED